MRISFVVNPVYINGGWSPWDTRIGGSEECVVEWSWRLALKHTVKVFHNGQHGVYKGVEYLSHKDFEPGDVTINVNYPQFIHPGRAIYWTSLTDNPDLDRFEAVCVISNYAKEHTNINHPNVYVVPPGYDPEQIYPGSKIAKQCFYASSPDRGLDTLLQVWSEVYAAHPDATLLLTYGAVSDLPGVISLGECDEATMNDIYRTSDIWCHPANGGELYCMTGVKAQAAGCIPVYFPVMALAETVRDGIACTPTTLARELIATLGDVERKQAIRATLQKGTYPTWDQTAKRLEEIMYGR